MISYLRKDVSQVSGMYAYIYIASYLLDGHHVVINTHLSMVMAKYLIIKLMRNIWSLKSIMDYFVLIPIINIIE